MTRVIDYNNYASTGIHPPRKIKKTSSYSRKLYEVPNGYTYLEQTCRSTSIQIAAKSELEDIASNMPCYQQGAAAEIHIKKIQQHC